RKPSELNNDETFTNDKEQVIKEMLDQNKENPNNQDILIKELRGMGFVFITSDFLKYIIPDTYEISSKHKEKYQWLIKVTKYAKDPKNDKYDPQIMVGIQIMEGRSDRVILYAYGKFVGSYRIAVPEKKAMKVGKTNLIKFPHYMNEEERLKWGFE